MDTDIWKKSVDTDIYIKENYSYTHFLKLIYSKPNNFVNTKKKTQYILYRFFSCPKSNIFVKVVMDNYLQLK